MQNTKRNDEDFMKNLSSSLADQVKEEMERENVERRRRTGNKKRKKKKKKRGIILKVVLTIIFILFLAAGFLTLTPMGRKLLTRIAVEYMYSKLDDKPKKKKKKTKEGGKNSDSVAQEELVKGEITENIDLSEMSETFKNAAHEDGVYNILLLGVEAIFDKVDTHGRTDSIMIATINTKKNTLGLTSLMRDSYVKIPGYQDNRINTAYALGGVPLMYETIAENFGIRLDGSAVVGFDSFQEVIDDLGGVEIEITEGEAKYLNTTNYISEKKNRTLKPGKNLMNGNQALGYSRVRKIATLDGSNNDMGRTSRHRRVMTAVFQKFKKSNPATLVSVMNTVLPKVQTDVTKSNAGSYLAELLELSLKGVPLDTLRLPEDNALREVKVNGSSMVGVDWEKTKPVLMNFIFSNRVKDEPSVKKDGQKEPKAEQKKTQ